MHVLAFDTTMATCSVAVCTPDREVHLHEAMAHGRGHAERLMPMIQQAMADAGLGFAELDRIAVTRGPGSFTGVRIGIAAARGLALATGLPVIAVSTLQALAWSAPAMGVDLDAESVAVALDARRGEVYFQLFSPLSDALSPLTPPAALSPEAAAQALPPTTTQVLGSGAELVIAASGKAGELTAALLDTPPHMPTLARQAAHLATSDAPVRPLYLRAPDAKPQDGKSLPHLPADRDRDSASH